MFQYEMISHTGLESNMCCICQEPCVNPVQLPCTHIFCFLCIKGVAARNSHCALCRYPILPGFLTNPSVVNREELKTRLGGNTATSHKWYYEARNGGWWLYEHRTCNEIEKAFQDNRNTVRCQISGFYYTIDFTKMIQYREDIPSRRRKIKRDRVTTEVVKGVAGIVFRGPEGDYRELSINTDEDLSTGSDVQTSSDRDQPVSQSTLESEEQARLVTGLD